MALVLALALMAAVGLVWPAPSRVDAAEVGLLDCEFGKFQAFDVQWYIDGNSLFVSSVVPPFTAHPTAHSLTVDPPDPELTDTDYFKFVATDYDVPSPNPGGQTAIGFELYRADGTLKLRMQDFGVFRAYGPDFIFYLGEGSWGTVITTGEALPYGSSAELQITRNSDDGIITADDMLAYQCSSEPLPAPGTVTVTAPSGSMTAGAALPDLTPTVDPAAGLSTPASCAVFTSTDTTFASPVTITSTSAAGDYVVHCSGAVAASGYGPVVYVDGTLTVAAAPTTTTTTTTTTSTSTTSTSTPSSTTTTVAASDLPATGQDSTYPMMVLAVTLLCLGAGFVVLERSRRTSEPLTVTMTAADTMVRPRSEPRIPAIVRLEPEPVVVVVEPEPEPVVVSVEPEPMVVVVEPEPMVVPVEPDPEPWSVVTVDDPAAVAMERAALLRRLAIIEGRTDAHSLAWAQRLRQRLESLGG